jgi:hypothetical protein
VTKNDAKNLYESLQSQSTYITGEAKSSNSSFPFVSIRGFEVHGRAVRSLSKLEMSIFCPIVEQSDVKQWERFVEENEEWINDSREQAAKSPEKARIPSLNTNPSEEIRISRKILSRNFTSGTSDVAEVTDGEVLLPWWYQTPPPSKFTNINVDVLSHPSVRRLYHLLLERKAPVVSRFIDVRPFVDNHPYHADFHQQCHVVEEQGTHHHDHDHGDHHHRQLDGAGERLDEDEALQRPHSIVLYPVFRDLYEQDSPIVGVLLAVVAWDMYIEGLLPPGRRFVQVVVESTCDQEVTYVIDGPEVSRTYS